jgi:phosphoribosylanthranilate isomerase
MKIKVCGMKYQENIKEAVSLQPDYMGFIFWEPSSRFFKGQMPEEFPETIKKTGVFVNEHIDSILNKVEKFSLNAIQLHGNESENFCAMLKETLKESLPSNTELIKVFSIKDNFDFSLLESFEPYCDYFLFDTKGKLPGGNGYTFDWSVLKSYPSKKPYFLSGGIGIDQIEEINQFLEEPAAKYCYAVDVNSRFESKPGFKNIELLNRFINSLKNKN